MVRLSYVLSGLLVLFTACKQAETVKTTRSGLKYSVIKSGDGVTGKKGEILVFDFQLKDSKDSVWNDSYKEGLPAAMEIRDTTEVATEDGVAQMLRLLSAGDSVRTTMTIPAFFKDLVRRPPPPSVDTTGSVTYTINVKDVMTFDEFLAWREKTTTERDSQQIKKYLADNKLEAKQDTSGIFYILHNSTGGAKPTPENCVEVKYEGKFLKDGRPFDKNEKIGFSLNEVIRGWKLSIPMLAKGDSGTFFIPSKLAYGPQGYPGAIPPDAVLIFKVQLLDFKDEVDPATRTCK
jgi:FKBP-type peptidyl-prolyl cis-trans isomerase FkpA